MRVPQDDGCEGCSKLRANRLDIVAIGINEKRRVVGRAVIRARAGAAIVAAAGLQSFGMEFLDRAVIRRAERDMGAGAGSSLVQMQPERGLALGAKARAGIIARAQHKAERREGCRIEAHRGIEVSDAQSDMVVHCCSPVKVRGTPRNPMSRAEIIEKARNLTAPILGRAKTERLIEVVYAIETITDIRKLRPLLQRG